MSMSSTTTTTTHESAPQTEISTGSQIRAMAFTANGKHLVSGDKEAVRVWRVADRKQKAMVKARDVRSIAVSKDGQWIAAGESWGETRVWDTSQSSLKEVFMHDEDGHTVTSVDFSPDPALSTPRLVIASGRRAASIWDIKTNKEVVGPLSHQYWVIAAKFSPQGDRIATATRVSVRVYDSRNGNLLTDIPANVTPYYNTGLLWSNEYIIILSKHTVIVPVDTIDQSDNHDTTKQINNNIKKINVSNQSIFSEWSFPPDSNYASIVSSKFGIICSAGCTVTLCKSSASTVPLIQLPPSQDAHSIALSPNSQLLAIGGGDGKVTFIDIPAAISSYAASEAANSNSKP